MKAVIVAAGQARRLYPLTLNIPKPLLEINGLPIIEHSINNLQKNGIKDIAVVVGYLKEHFCKALKGRVTFIHNPFYAFTNDMASLWCAKGFIHGDGFLYLHGDLLYHPGLIKKCLHKKGQIVLVVDKKRCDSEDMKVRVKNNLFIESAKEIPLDKAYGEWIGMARFSKRGGHLIFGEIDKILAEGKFDLYDTYAFTRLAKHGYKINICHTQGAFWMEIDFVEELKMARKFNLRLIKDGRK